MPIKPPFPDWHAHYGAVRQDPMPLFRAPAAHPRGFGKFAGIWSCSSADWRDSKRSLRA